MGLVLVLVGLIIYGKDAFLPFLTIERPKKIPKPDAIIFGIGGILLIFGVLSFAINRLVQHKTDQQLEKIEEDLMVIHERLDSLTNLFDAMGELSEALELVNEKVEKTKNKDTDDR